MSWNLISRSWKRRSTINPFANTNVCSAVSVTVDLSFAAEVASMESRTPSSAVLWLLTRDMKKHLSASESQSRDSSVPPRAAGKPPLPATLCWSTLYLPLSSRNCLFNTREGALPNGSNVFGDFLVGGLALFTAANGDHREVVLHPSRSAPVAPPALVILAHVEQQMHLAAFLGMRVPFVGWPEPTSKLSTVLIPEVRACLSPASSDCSSRAKCRPQRFRLAALARLDRVGG